MKELFFNTIQEFNDYIGVKTLHPLVSIAHVENTAPIQQGGRIKMRSPPKVLTGNFRPSQLSFFLS